MRSYRHSQIGSVIIGSMVAVIVVIFILVYTIPTKNGESPHVIAVTTGLLLLFSLILFYKLTVQVTEEKLRIQFGIGLIRRSWLLSDIVSTEIIRYPWWYGWGIHFTPHGTIFNVSGFTAVAVRLKSGRTALIGTDEPEKLRTAIEEFRSSTN
jgi:hypothetical protein